MCILQKFVDLFGGMTDYTLACAIMAGLPNQLKQLFYTSSSMDHWQATNTNLVSD